jgi:phosphoribosylanthranilate isomerase
LTAPWLPPKIGYGSTFGCSLRVKICGITNEADAILAAEAGADAIGLNFVGGPRMISPTVARDILRSLPPLLTPVALVRVDEQGLPRELVEMFNEFRVAHLQLYASARGEAALADPAGCGPAGRPVLSALIAAGFRPMPALAVRDSGFAQQLADWGSLPSDCRPSAVVLDAYDPKCAGGTGRSFCWDWINQGRGGSIAWPPILLAGGLTSENVAEAVRVVRPYGVDVSSGVERAGSPGRKDPAKVKAFIRNASEALHTHDSERTT